MRITSSWKHRRRFLPYYEVTDFDDSWDYFVYLHLNPHVQFLHLGGTLVGLSLFPWAMWELFTKRSVLPTLIFTFFYYGVGFISHYSGDGQVSGTWKHLLLTYYQAARMNLLVLRGRFRLEEERFLKRYPHTLWVYLSELPLPADAEAWANARARGEAFHRAPPG